MSNMSRIAFPLIIAALALPAAGCARNKGKAGDTEYIARDVNTLYALAKK